MADPIITEADRERARKLRLGSRTEIALALATARAEGRLAGMEEVIALVQHGPIALTRSGITDAIRARTTKEG